MSARVAFITCSQLKTLSASDQLLATALERRGCQVTSAVWDDPKVKWVGFDLAVIRSPWDYFKKMDAFRTWLDVMDRSRLRIWNPLSLVRWNIEKGYLRELERSGVPIVS